MSEVRDLLRGLLTEEARRLQGVIRTADLLSKPVEDGRWRWADIDSGGYRRKSEADLALMYERNRVRAADARKRRLLVLAIRENLQDLELFIE